MPKPLCPPLSDVLPVLALLLATPLAASPVLARNAQDSAPVTPASQPLAPPAADSETGATIAGQTYADLVDLALASPVVVRATIHRQFRLKPDESPGLAPGFARLYFEADTTALLVGPDLGESLRFLADVPTDAAGKVPKLAKTPVMVFGKVVPNRPGELQLTAPDTMLPWTPALDSQIRAILTELIKPDAPPAITGVREALHVPGNLAGEGETQFFFATANARPVSISVVRRPGEPTRWGVSFGEIVDQAAQPPQPRTLAWYRLACALPPTLPAGAAISDSAADRQIAAEDYALVLRELGPCTRNRARR